MGAARPGGAAAGPYELVHDGDLRDRVFLVKHNVPFDVALSMDDNTVKAWVIMLGEYEGGVFDWDMDEWSRRDA